MSPQVLHKKALAIAAEYQRVEAELVEVIQEIDWSKAYLKLGYGSCFDYVVRGLCLSEAVASNAITVARKAREVPALKEVIASGKVSLAKARKITPVLNRDNQAEWLTKLQSLPQRQIEKEVARLKPKLAVPEKARFITENRLQLQIGVSENLMANLRRVQDLESQRLRKTATLEDTLESLASLYLQKKDPLFRAERIGKISKSERDEKSEEAEENEKVMVTLVLRKPVARHVKRRKALPQKLKYQIDLRDRWRCQFKGASDEKICGSTRWLDYHHLLPVSRGGKDHLDNLVTLCQAHHRLVHAED